MSENCENEVPPGSAGSIATETHSAFNHSVLAKEVEAAMDDLKDAVKDISICDGGVAFTYPEEPKSPKPILTERQSCRTPKGDVETAMKAAEERREKHTDDIRRFARADIERAKEVVSKAKNEDEEFKAKATARVEEKMMKADEIRSQQIDMVKEKCERENEREAAAKVAREENDKKVIKEYSDMKAIALEKQNLVVMTIEQLSEILAQQENHKKALELVDNSGLFATKDQYDDDVKIVATNRRLLIELIDHKLTEEQAVINKDNVNKDDQGVDTTKKRCLVQ